MGGDDKDKVETMVPLNNVYDGDRGMALHRGVFYEAPPGFFAKYGRDMARPKKPFDPKVDRKMRITEWLGKPVLREEAPAPAPPVEAAPAPAMTTADVGKKKTKRG